MKFLGRGNDLQKKKKKLDSEHDRAFVTLHLVLILFI